MALSIFIAALPTLLVAPAFAAAQSTKPNLMFILAEYARARTLTDR